MIGETVSRYRVVARLGAGSMGDVYRAEDLRLGRPVALKVVRTASGAPSSSERLLAEARAASALTHPNIAVVYEVDEVDRKDGRVGFIAMEYVAGARSPSSWNSSNPHSIRFSTSGARSPMRSRPRTPKVSYIETSSRPTSWSRTAAL